MRRAGIGLLLAVLLIGGGLLWLERQATNKAPQTSEKVIQIDDILDH